MLLSALFNLLNYSEYPMLAPEVALVSVVLILIAICTGFLHRLAPRLSFLFTAGLVAVGFSLNGASALIVNALGLGTLVLAWFYDRAMLRIVTTAFTVVALFQFGGGLIDGTGHESGEARASIRNDLPPIVHLILDGYVGTEGMAADPVLAQLREETIAFYTGHGFRLYDGAYSRHALTANSIPYALSFGEAPLATTSRDIQHILPPKLEYFTLLKRNGYAISSLHPDFIDLCATQPIDRCRTFRRSDLSAAAHFGLSTIDRAKLIGLNLANMGRLPNALYERWRWLVMKFGGKQPPNIVDQAKLFSQGSVKALEGFTKELANAGKGEVYFAHFLLPHDPYAFDPECGIRPHDQWLTQSGPETTDMRHSLYADQVRCTMVLIDKLLKTLDNSSAGRGAIVILHGDHGSRNDSQMPDASNPRKSARSFATTYSTLFAVRAPGIEPGLISGRAPLEELIGDLALSEFRQAPKADDSKAQIYLTDMYGIPRMRVDLPHTAHR